MGGNNYTNVQDALSGLNSTATRGFDLTTSASAGTASGSTLEQVATGETVTVDAGKNIAVTQAGNTITIATKDDVTFTTVTANKTTVGNVVTDGTTNKISGLSDGSVTAGSTEAITGNQLYGVSNSLKNVLGGNAAVGPDGTISMSNVGGTGKDNVNDAIASVNQAAANANKGWNLTANGANSSNVAPGATVDLNNTDGNIVITKTDNNVTFNLNKDLKADSLTTGDTTVNTNGLTIAGGPSVTKAGIDAAGTKVTNVANGAVTADSKDAVNGSQLYAVQSAMQDTVKNSTFGLTAQDGNSVVNTLNNTVSVVGGADSSASASASNIKTVVKDGKLEVQVVDAPTFNGEITANGGVTVGDNLTVKSGTKVDMGGNVISNVGAGVADTDAVNVGQLNTAMSTINTNVGQVANKLNGAVKDANAGIAGAMASAGVPQAYLPGKSMVAASGSTYRGASAIAIGVSTISDNGKWVFKGTVNSNSRGYVGATVGAGYQW